MVENLGFEGPNSTAMPDARTGVGTVRVHAISNEDRRRQHETNFTSEGAGKKRLRNIVIRGWIVLANSKY